MRIFPKLKTKHMGTSCIYPSFLFVPTAKRSLVILNKFRPRDEFMALVQPGINLLECAHKGSTFSQEEYLIQSRIQFKNSYQFIFSLFLLWFIMPPPKLLPSFTCRSCLAQCLKKQIHGKEASLEYTAAYQHNEFAKFPTF